MRNWTLAAKREDGKSSESYLTLVFATRGGEWLMEQDQNTPVIGA